MEKAALSFFFPNRPGYDVTINTKKPAEDFRLFLSSLRGFDFIFIQLYPSYSTVTDFARFLGLSTSMPFARDV